MTGPGLPRVAIAADHNGLELKDQLRGWLETRGHEVEDRGAGPDSGVVDYPLLCADVCQRVGSGAVAFGVVLGGGGTGETMACNKVPGIRAALCHDVFLAEVARGNNDANVLVMGAKVIAPAAAERVLATWLATGFRGGRHADRLAMIARLERGEPLD